MNYKVVKSKRKTICISIVQSKEIIIRVPLKTTQKKIDEILKLRQNWIDEKIKQLSEKNFFKTKKEYKNGETISFLGKIYTMHFIETKKNVIEIDEDNIIIWYKKETNVEKILQKWFYKQAERIFTERFAACYKFFCEKFSYEECIVGFPILKLRKMKARWGSCSKKRVIVLNTTLIHTSIECIDYVIFHEFCHLKHHNHGKGFYEMQTDVNPDWKKSKIALQYFMGEVFSL